MDAHRPATGSLRRLSLAIHGEARVGCVPETVDAGTRERFASAGPGRSSSGCRVKRLVLGDLRVRWFADGGGRVARSPTGVHGAGLDRPRPLTVRADGRENEREITQSRGSPSMSKPRLPPLTWGPVANAVHGPITVVWRLSGRSSPGCYSRWGDVEPLSTCGDSDSWRRASACPVGRSRSHQWTTASATARGGPPRRRPPPWSRRHGPIPAKYPRRARMFFASIPFTCTWTSCHPSSATPSGL